MKIEGARSFGLVVGTRPSFIMAAPIIAAFDDANVPLHVLHSGQHYSDNMNAVFFEDLGIRPPDHLLPTAADQKSPARQISAIMIGVEDWLQEAAPKALIVMGDTNSNLGGALAARKLNVPLAHVEAGERADDLRGPEEQNRRIIDHISDLNFATNARSRDNLRREGIADDRIEIVGNTIVDTALKNKAIAMALDLSKAEFAPILRDRFALMTLHRQEHVDDPEILSNILADVRQGAAALRRPVLFFAHPRTLGRLEAFGMIDQLNSDPLISLLPGAGYLEFLHLLQKAAFVITDSGGVQQESCIIGTPAVTIMASTPWPDTLEIGANELCRPGRDAIAPAMARADAKNYADKPWPQPFGDGTTSIQILAALQKRYEDGRT